ncbi:MAG: DNA primase, partial [Oscillospiraceae bacterium]
QKASSRAITILEKLDLKVRVLRLVGAKDPDEYISKNGAVAFENLLARSETHIEYMLADVVSKYDLSSDESRVAFLREATELIASLPGEISREVYALKAADIAKVSGEAVLAEVSRARKKKLGQAKKKQENESLRPTRANQPRERSLHYENIRSATAEQGVIRLLYLDPSLFSDITNFSGEDFSVPLFGRFFTELRSHSKAGASPSLSLLGESFENSEISLLTEILQKPQELKNGEAALNDYINIIKSEKLAIQQKNGGDEAALLEYAKNKQQSKGYGG